VNPDLRTALLGIGIVFCVMFAAITLYAMADLGFGLQTYGDLLGLVFYGLSLLVIVMIGIGLYGAIKNPPPDE